MSKSLLFIKILCVFLVLGAWVMISGCTTPFGEGGIQPETPSPSTPVSPLPSVSAPASNTQQPGSGIQLEGNVYGISSNPHVGIDTITFTIGLALKAPEVDLTRMEIVFSTSGTSPVILTWGTRDSTSTFTTSRGNNAITTLRPGDEAEITFRVRGIPAGGKVTIELKPAAGAGLPISRTVPAMLYATNILG